MVKIVCKRLETWSNGFIHNWLSHSNDKLCTDVKLHKNYKHLWRMISFTVLGVCSAVTWSRVSIKAITKSGRFLFYKVLPLIESGISSQHGFSNKMIEDLCSRNWSYRLSTECHHTLQAGSRFSEADDSVCVLFDSLSMLPYLDFQVCTGHCCILKYIFLLIRF